MIRPRPGVLADLAAAADFVVIFSCGFACGILWMVGLALVGNWK